MPGSRSITARKPIIPVRADEGTKERWQAAAAEDGMGLSEFIRVAVEEKIAGAAPYHSVKSYDGAIDEALGSPPPGGKKTYAADPKGGKAKK